MTMNALLEQIVVAAESGLDLIAIGMAVSLPAICVSLESKDGRSTERDYKGWCEVNLADGNFSFVSPDDLYSLRCGFLHQGKVVGLKHDVERVLFVPAGSPMSFANCRINNAYMYGVPEFCRNMCAAADRWLKENEGKALVQERLQHLVTYHPRGISPYVSGFAVIG